MAETVLSFVLNQLSIFLHEERSHLGGLRQEVQLIRDELEHMRAFLKVAEAKEDDPRLQVWIKQIREAAYDTEDVLDKFVRRFAHHREHGFYGSFRRIFNSIKSLRARHSVAGEIRSIRARINNISEGHQRYHSDEYGASIQVSGSLAVVNNNTWCHSRDDALLVEEAQLIGVEKPKQHLISQLLEGHHSQLKVISVVGMGGLGKTTLVKKVHEDINVRRHFPVRAWVTVSQTCDFRELLKNLIQQLHEEIKKPVPPLIESMTSTVKLKEFIKDFLQEAERYAIVFDDVWHVEFWNEIRFALPENSCGNRVILTTRKADVASASCIQSHDYVYQMKPLSFEESWILFCNKTFKDNCCPDHLNNVAESVLCKCEGLPLAILAISGLLAVKDVNRVDEWKMIQHSLGGELEGTGKLDRVKKILCLSYNDLPSHLKACLLYISIFPEDYEMKCYRLIHLWIAKRFVEWRGVSFEDVGWGYLRELVNRSLIQVSEVFYEGIPYRCRIHDLLREVIISKAREQNMVTIATGQHIITWPPEKVRRLVIYGNFLPNCNDHSQESHYSFDHLRSLITLFESNKPSLCSKNLLAKVLSTSSSRLLKVLDLRNAQMLDKIPNEVFNLFHLNHLDLNGTRVETVPKCIGKLQKLEYLDLGDTKVRELPMEILKLKKLCHLRIYQRVKSIDADYGYFGFKALLKMGGLLSLYTLDTIDAAENRETKIVEEIRKLTKLKDLKITNLRREDGKELCSSLVNLTSLERLYVASAGKDYDYEVIDLNHHHSLSSSYSSSSFLQSLCYLSLRGRLEKMPQWITSLQSLVRIQLIWSGLRGDVEDPLESLQHLPNLAQVYLSPQAYQGEGLRFKTRGFPKLKELHLRKLQGLRWMRVEEGAMPRLQRLILQKLPLLEDLPLGIQHLTQLQKLELYNMSSQLVEKMENQKKESEDYRRRIAHVPEITISIWTEWEWRRRQLWGEEKKT